MKHLLTHKDGRLKVGLVSITLFVLLLALGGGLMRLNQPVDEALVQIKHVFRAEPNAIEPMVQETTPAVEQTANVKPPLPQLSGTKAATESVAEAVSATPGEPQEVVREDRVSTPEVAMTSGEEKDLSTREAATEAVVEIVQTAEILSEEPAEAVVQPPLVKIALKPGVARAAVDEPAQAEKPTDPFLKLQQGGLGERAEQSQSLAVTLSPQRYQEVFNAWRSSSVPSEQETKLPGLLVENLRDVYPLFQMKPVALVGGVAYDLEDGNRLADRSLDRYTTTVFEVANPWEDWGSTLRRIGVRPSDKVEVRYYLHDYVHNGIYGRCEQAIAWGKGKGLLAGDVNAAEVEVRGRAYAVRQQGGGQFGVFIPNQLRLADGRTLRVDAEAMAGAMDVVLLQKSAIL